MIRLKTFNDLLNVLLLNNDGQIVIEYSFDIGQWIDFEFMSVSEIKKYFTLNSLLTMWDKEENIALFFSKEIITKKHFIQLEVKEQENEL